MDLDKVRIASIARQARSVHERYAQLVKDAQSLRYPFHSLNDAQRIFIAAVATQARQTAHTAMEQIGLHAGFDVPSIDAMLADKNFGDCIETYMKQASRFLGTHPELLLAARINISQLLMRTAIELLNHSSGVLEGSESISGRPIGRGPLWDK